MQVTLHKHVTFQLSACNVPHLLSKLSSFSSLYLLKAPFLNHFSPQLPFNSLLWRVETQRQRAPARCIAPGIGAAIQV